VELDGGVVLASWPLPATSLHIPSHIAVAPPQAQLAWYSLHKSLKDGSETVHGTNLATVPVKEPGKLKK